jgi:hypothetical protein
MGYIENGFTFAILNLSRKIANSKEALSISLYFSLSHWKNKRIVTCISDYRQGLDLQVKICMSVA